jgi:hypothetical protein
MPTKKVPGKAQGKAKSKTKPAPAKAKAKAKAKPKATPAKAAPKPKAKVTAPPRAKAKARVARPAALPTPRTPSPQPPASAPPKAPAAKPVAPAAKPVAPAAKPPVAPGTPVARPAPAAAAGGTSPALTIDLGRARAHWHRRQGLAEPVGGAVDAVVAATGWPRTLGGSDVYLAVRARVPGMPRQALDEAVQTGKLQVVPAVRGCIYLVPRAEVPLVMRVAEEQYRKRTERELQKVGVDAAELKAVGAEVVKVLAGGPLAPDALRQALPEGSVRSLGEKGKKLGMSSPLPTALRYLEFEGKVERTLAGGRLDSERYEWRLPATNPFAGAKVPAGEVERNAAIARRFFSSAGPATLRDLANWTGLAQKDASAAMDRLPLAPVKIEGWADEAYVLEDELPRLREGAGASSTVPVSFLPFEDNFIVLHGGPGLFVDPRHHGRTIPVWGTTRGTTLGDATHMSMRALVEGDRITGLWEYDPDQKRIVFGTFEPMAPARRKQAEAQAEDLGRFLREEIGHARSFVLDTENALRERARLVKTL